MEQNNRFFVYDSYVFAFKNALANVRIFFMAYLIWLIALIPLAIIAFVMNRALFTTNQTMLALSSSPLSGLARASFIVTSMIQSSGVMMLATVLIGLLILGWISAGFVRIGLRIHDTGEAHISDIFPSPLLIIKAVIGIMLFMFIALLGFICFIVPGIYFLIRAWFYMYALVEGDGIFEAFSTSFRITRDKGWQLLPLLILSGTIAKVTMFFGGPILVLSNAYIYRLLKKSA